MLARGRGFGEGLAQDGRRGKHECDGHPEDLVTEQADDDRREDDESDQERAIERKGEERIRHHQIAIPDDLRKQRGLGGDEEDRHGRDEKVHQINDGEARTEEEQRHDRRRAERVRDDEHEPAIAPVDDDTAGDTEEDRRENREQDEH